MITVLRLGGRVLHGVCCLVFFFCVHVLKVVELVSAVAASPAASDEGDANASSSWLMASYD